MGPEATILLQRKIIEVVPALDYKDHIPLLIDMNPQAPSRLAHLIDGTGDDPGPVLAAMAVRLRQMGAAALAMPCNTAHHYADAITAASNITFLNMIDLAANHAVRTVGEGGRIGILASPATKKAGLFERVLNVKGLSVHWPDCDEAILAAIRLIKSEGPVKRARNALTKASAMLDETGVDLQLIACTEFSLIADSVAPGVDAVDILDLLVQEIVDFSTAR